MHYDFSGYVTRNDIRCSDGRTIRHNAFAECDGAEVPLVWHHQRNSPENVLGKVKLENRPDGVYGYGIFNDTDNAKISRSLVEHGDVKCMSIYANNLSQRGGDVLHGKLIEVSLVLAGANPGAYIDNIVIEHSDGTFDVDEGEATIYFITEGDDIVMNDELYDLQHEDDPEEATEEISEDSTISEVFDSLTDIQKQAVYAMIGMAIEDSEDDDSDDIDDTDNEVSHDDYNEGGIDQMYNHNIFEGVDEMENSLTHDEEVAIFRDAQRIGSLRDSILEHGIDNIDILFPEAKAVNVTPELISRQMEWVSKVWNATRKSPFSRIKSTAADLTKDEARARGYIKGKKKIEEQFALLKRVTTPTTVYKKQGLDRDDVIDITDFDVVTFLKAEMRMMLNEELARAIMIGDGRLTSDESKINEQNIRPIYSDNDMYTIHHEVVYGANATDDDKANAIVTAANRSRKDYKGSGSPVLYIDSDNLTTLLLAKDKVGRRLYPTLNELASAMRVREIVEVPVMEGITRTFTPEGSTTSKTMELVGIIVNLTDYVVGADRGGAVSMFDDFDIDYNRQKYLIETRCSGALVKPYSAIVLETAKTTSSGDDGNGDDGDDGDDGDNTVVGA